MVNGTDLKTASRMTQPGFFSQPNNSKVPENQKPLLTKDDNFKIVFCAGKYDFKLCMTVVFKFFD